MAKFVFIATELDRISLDFKTGNIFRVRCTLTLFLCFLIRFSTIILSLDLKLPFVEEDARIKTCLCVWMDTFGRIAESLLGRTHKK